MDVNGILKQINWGFDMKNYKEKIQFFVDYYKNQTDSVNNLPDSVTNMIFKKILLFSIIDGISKCVYPYERFPRTRFTSALQTYSEWDNGNRISLLYLNQLLSKNSDPAHRKLREFVNKRLPILSTFNETTIDIDPLPEEIEEVFPEVNIEEYQINKIKLEYLKHWHIFYFYRNLLIHESQQSGKMSDDFIFDKPAYLHMHSINPEQKIDSSWHLIYPVAHFLRLCESLLKNAEEYLYETKLDPLQYYSVGAYYIDDLNL